MGESNESARSPSEETPTKGREAPPTTGRGSKRQRPEKPADDDKMEEAKKLMRSALSELRGGSRPGVNRAMKSINAALDLL